MTEFLLLVGTYTRREPHVAGNAEGIYTYRFDTADGTLHHVATAAGIKNPSFLTTDPERRSVYAVSEIADLDGGRTGAVAAFALDQATGTLQPLNTVRSQGAGPCYVTVDATGACVLVANYGSGAVALLPIEEGGALGEAAATFQHRFQPGAAGVNTARQEAPHAHSITLDPANRYALAADLGTDELRVYALDPSIPTMTPQTTVALTPGAGPRHIAFHPNGDWLYVINELDSTITRCDYAADTGAVTARQRISTLPADFDGVNTCADIHVHPTGQFVYGSNRGHDSIAVFAVDPASGELTAAGHAPTQGRTPRNFTLSRDGQFLLAANQDSGDVVVFRIDAATGGLTPLHTARIPSPVCLHLLD